MTAIHRDRMHPTPPPRLPLHKRARDHAGHQANRVRQAWKRYYHYLRLERHGSALPWHGMRGWSRAVFTALLLALVVVWGLHHTLSAAGPATTTILP